MGKKDPRVDAYIAKSPDFAKPILTYLREVIHQGCPAVVETIKWGTPTFDHHGILAGIAAFKQHCVLGFWKAPLLTLEGKPLTTKMESGAGQFGKLTTLKDLPSKSTLLRLVRDSAKLNESGVRLERKPRPAVKPPVQVPADLRRALLTNAKARAVFAGFSPSHKREYAEWIAEAKTPETRQRRVDSALEWIGEGKPRNWKYMKK
jgi:uncharacterized protein YdeI (YjbR/CyaY-like superfamily)